MDVRSDVCDEVNPAILPSRRCPPAEDTKLNGRVDGELIVQRYPVSREDNSFLQRQNLQTCTNINDDSVREDTNVHAEKEVAWGSCGCRARDEKEYLTLQVEELQIHGCIYTLPRFQ